MPSALSVRTHGVLARGLWPRVAVTTAASSGLLLCSGCTDTTPPGAATPSRAPAAAGGSGATVGTLPDPAKASIAKPAYAGARWLYHVGDAQTGEVLLAQRPDEMAFIASTNKNRTVGALYDTIGADARITTPVYATAAPAGGVVTGDLVLVGSGDLTLGGPQGVRDRDSVGRGHRRRPAIHALPGAERQAAHHPDPRQRERGRRHGDAHHRRPAGDRRIPAEDGSADRAPPSGSPTFVGTFRVEDPAAFARTAFIEVLRREDVTVGAPPRRPTPAPSCLRSAATSRTARSPHTGRPRMRGGPGSCSR